LNPIATTLNVALCDKVSSDWPTELKDLAAWKKESK